MFSREIFLCLFIVTITFTAFAQTAKISEGSLQVVGSDGNSKGLCPLKHTDVKAEISGFLSRVTVTQTFQNPFNEKIEAIYAFPLPNDAAVDDMTIKIGERTIRSKILEREEAKKTYEQAKTEGKVAAIIEQQRPNLFTQAVANISPNVEIQVIISYVETLKYKDGSYQFNFPMTVGERYMPFSVNDSDKISPSQTSETERRISLEVKLDTGVSIEQITSNSHEIQSDFYSANQAVVRLKNAEIPNRDFNLKIKTAGEKIEDAILFHKAENGGFFTMILQPPDKILPADTMPKEIVFVLDTSGSMEGFPLEKAKESMMLALEGVNPNDTFNLITFAGETKILFPQPVSANRENIEIAKKLLSGVSSGGGTEMMTAIKAALEPSDSQNHVRIVCFMTDGYVGNEFEIINEVKNHPNARVFGFGIGNSVNRYFLDEISREGRGDVEYVSANDDGSAAARRFYERVRNPLLTDISLEFQGIETAEIFPTEIPDLFSAKPIYVAGRYKSGGNGKVILRGKMQGQPFQREIAVNFPERNEDKDVLSTLWARKKVSELMRQDLKGVQNGTIKDDLKKAIINLGLEFRLLTQFTSFVAVDEQIITENGVPKRVEVPVVTPSQEQFIENYWQRRGGGSGGGVLTTVDVTSGAEVVNTSDQSITTTTEVTTLPQIAKGNSVETPVSIPSGVVNFSAEFGKHSISSNGQQPTANIFQVDGNNVNLGVTVDETSLARNAGATPAVTASGSTASIISENAVDEIRITTYGMPRDQKTGGATVTVITKGGSNAHHGSAFETFGGKGLNANDFFANSRNSPRAESSLNQFGGTFGGYLKKDKAFFFSSYEGLRLKKSAFAVSEVPTIFSRQNASMAMQNLLNSFPLPNGRITQNGLAEFASTFTNPASHNTFGLRIDARPTSNLNLTGRTNLTNSDAKTRGSKGFSLNTLRKFEVDTKTITGKIDYTATPNIVIVGRVSFAENLLSQKFSLDSFGGANVAQNLFANSFTKYDFLGKNSSLANGEKIQTKANQFETQGELIAVFGSHSFNFTGNFRQLSFNFGANPNERNVVFAGVTNSLNGNAARINEILRSNLPKVNFNNFSATAEDAYRITPNTTLNFGVRWDVNSAPRNLWKTDYANFAPRIGLAQSFFNDRGVIRAGIGLFYDSGNPIASDYFANSAPFLSGKSANNVIFSSTPSNLFLPNTSFNSNLQTPRTWQFSASYQQEIVRNVVFSINYVNSIGRTLYFTETRNGINRQVSNNAKSDYQALNFSLDRSSRNGIYAMVNYTLAKSEDNFSPDSPRRAIIQQSQGFSDFDAKHNLKGLVSFTPKTIFANNVLKQITKDWTFSTLFTYRTALPLNIVYARLNDVGVEYYRPNLLENVVLQQANGELNPLAFSVPTITSFGNLERNFLRSNSLFQLDFGISKQVKLTSDMRLTFSANASNLLNYNNLATPNNVVGTQIGNSFITNSTFGKNFESFGSNSFSPFYYAGGARMIKLSAKFRF
jgi:Ca-activated chloride channel homolog